MPLVRPSWLTPLPRITAWMRSPSANASRNRLSTTAPTPSPGTKPLASVSKVLQRPSGDSMRAWQVSRCIWGVTISDTPPATARSTSPLIKAWAARWVATRDDEQAVSSDTAGPFRFRKYDSRAARMELTLPMPNLAPTSESGAINLK